MTNNDEPRNITIGAKLDDGSFVAFREMTDLKMTIGELIEDLGDEVSTMDAMSEDAKVEPSAPPVPDMSFGDHIPSVRSVSPVAAGGRSFLEMDEHQMVMSFNVASASNLREWEERKATMLDLLLKNRPLLMGTQEALAVQLEYFEENLENYDYIGISRQGNTEDEYNAILYDSSRVTVEDSGTFWLSETPQEPGSMMPGGSHPRIATWGRFSIAGYPDSIYMINTHLSFEQDIIERQVEVLLQQIESIVPQGAEMIMTADFNRPRITHLWQMFQEAGFRDAWQLADTHAGPPRTFHGWEGLEARGGFEQGLVGDEADYQIDWVLYRTGEAMRITQQLLVQVITHHDEDIYPSDHFPVALMTLGSPDIKAAGLSVTPLEVVAHDELTATATVTNNGSAGVSEITLYVDRVPEQTQWVVLDAGESREVSFPMRLYAPGAHEVSIQLLPSQVVTVEGRPATLRFIDLNAAAHTLPGQVIPITARIENRGSYEGSVDVGLFVNNMLNESATVSVPPGSVREVGFVHRFEEAGVYSVTIGSQSMDINVVKEFGADWMFQRGDNPGWSSLELDDSAWESARLPSAWEDHANYTEDFVYGWYRQPVIVPAEWEGRPIRIIVGQIDDADKTFFNGELIGETGNFPEDKEGFRSEWNTIREYVVPAEQINYGAKNIVAVRIYDNLGGGGIHRGPLGMLPLDEDALNA